MTEEIKILIEEWKELREENEEIFNKLLNFLEINNQLKKTEN